MAAKSNLTLSHLSRSQPKALGSLDRDGILSEWPGGDAWCVGHAYDGVLWGRLQNGQLRFASDLQKDWGAQFRAETLTDLRLFQQQRELRIWKTPSGFHSCCLSESEGGEPCHSNDERYLLIQRPKGNIEDGEFVKMEGQAGQCHYPPGRPVPSHLEVRTYYRPDATGILRIFEHRSLRLVGKGEA